MQIYATKGRIVPDRTTCLFRVILVIGLVLLEIVHYHNFYK